MNMKTKEITEFGLILAAAFVLSYLESMIPAFIAIPGIKIGLANIGTMYMLYRYSPYKALIFTIIRVFLTSILFSGFQTILFGLTGGVFSIVFMLIGKKSKGFSLLGIGMLGAIAHNIGQIVVACFIMDNGNVFYYLPVLLISGIVTGCLVGYLTYLLLKKIHFK